MFCPAVMNMLFIAERRLKAVFRLRMLITFRAAKAQKDSKNLNKPQKITPSGLRPTEMTLSLIVKKTDFRKLRSSKKATRQKIGWFAFAFSEKVLKYRR